MSLFASFFSHTPKHNNARDVQYINDEVIDDGFVVLSHAQRSSVEHNTILTKVQSYPCTPLNSSTEQPACFDYRQSQTQSSSKLSDVDDVPVMLSPHLSDTTSMKLLLVDTMALLSTTYDTTFNNNKYHYEFTDEQRVVRENLLEIQQDYFTTSASSNNDICDSLLDKPLIIL